MTQSGAVLTGGRRSWGIRALAAFKKRSVTTNKTLRLFLYINFQKITEDFAGQKARKF
jgi:hypothetical protein